MERQVRRQVVCCIHIWIRCRLQSYLNESYITFLFEQIIHLYSYLSESYIASFLSECFLSPGGAGLWGQWPQGSGDGSNTQQTGGGQQPQQQQEEFGDMFGMLSQPAPEFNDLSGMFNTFTEWILTARIKARGLLDKIKLFNLFL